MKYFFVFLCTALITAGTVATQELTVSGEIKTGLYWEQKQIGDMDPESEARVHNNDDAGTGQGRFRLNLQVEKDNIGMKMRFEHTQWIDKDQPQWMYAFAYGNFFNDQLKLSAGKTGDSPWGGGGPEIWTELDNRIGIRTEIKPAILPGLNVGFVLNDFNATQNRTMKETIVDLLAETVLGFSYTHDLFAVRFAYRLDSEFDDGGAEYVYRLEERALKSFLEGFQIWANGYGKGIKDHTDEKAYDFINWLYFQYAPATFTAQLRVGYDLAYQREILHVRPSFFYNLFNNFVSVGASFQFAQDFGNKMYEDSPYLYLQVEPVIKVNFGPGAYAALAYHYTNMYDTKSTDWITQVHWINLRVVYTF